MKKIFLLVSLLLIAPMTILNPLGGSALIGHYTGIIAACAAIQLALTSNQSGRLIDARLEACPDLPASTTS